MEFENNSWSLRNPTYKGMCDVRFFLAYVLRIHTPILHHLGSLSHDSTHQYPQPPYGPYFEDYLYLMSRMI